MITLRRAKERDRDQRRTRETWLTFPLDLGDPPSGGFGTLESLNEDRLAPGAGVVRHQHHDVEVVTYAHEGALAYEDSMGCSGVIQGGRIPTHDRRTRHSPQ